MRIVTLCKYLFLALTFATIFHVNVIRPFVLKTADFDRELFERAQSPAARLYYGIITQGGKIGFDSQWKMYSPVPTWLRQLECYARDPQGRWVPVPFPDLSPAYRARRSWASALLWDFKRARINDNYFISAYSPVLAKIYLHYWAGQLEHTLGYRPGAMRMIVRGAPIPPPGRRGHFTPATATLDHVLAEYSYP